MNQTITSGGDHFYKMQINSTGGDVQLVDDLTIDNSLMITLGEFDTAGNLWIGTNSGMAKFNGGQNWVALNGGMPTVAVNDLVVHPRDNDLVLATHGRGVWILDQVNALQEITPAIARKAAHLFSMEPAEQVRYRGERAHTGNMIFEGENPPSGAIIDYWLAADADDVTITVHDGSGNQVASVRTSTDTGMNRAIWNLRHGDAPPPRGQGLGGFGGFGGASGGPLVVPGLYTVRLATGGDTMEKIVRVKEDPRIEVDALVRRQWTETLLAIGELRSGVQELAREVGAVNRAVEAGDRELAADVGAKVADLTRELSELTSRVSRLQGSASGWVGPLNADQSSQRLFFEEMFQILTGEWEQIRGQTGG